MVINIQKCCLLGPNNTIDPCLGTQCPDENIFACFLRSMDKSLVINKTVPSGIKLDPLQHPLLHHQSPRLKSPAKQDSLYFSEIVSVGKLFGADQNTFSNKNTLKPATKGLPSLGQFYLFYCPWLTPNHPFMYSTYIAFVLS